jgi:hypothetical protein
MSKGRSHNRNSRRLALLAAREAFWKREAGYYPPGSTGKPPVWTRLWLQRRGYRPLPKGFRLPKNGSRMRFVGAGYHPSFPALEPPEQPVSRLHRSGAKPPVIKFIEAPIDDHVLWVREKKIEEISKYFLVPDHLLGK